MTRREFIINGAACGTLGAVFGPADLAMGAATDAAAASGPVLEIAAYQLAATDGFAEKRAAAVEGVRGMQGFLWWAMLEGEDGSAADVLAWETLADAKAAAAAFSASDRFKAFHAAIGKVDWFGHVSPSTPVAELRPVIEAAPHVEIALYQVAAPDALDPVHTLLHAGKLPGRDGFLGGARLQSSEKPALRGDLLGWRDRSAWQQTGEAMMADPDLAAFFEQAGNQTELFQLYDRVGIV